MVMFVRRRGCRRKTAPSAWPVIDRKEAIMDCDICGQDVGNSDALLKHMERAHPTGAGDLEKPDHLGETLGESAEREVPKPTH
jgi:hypothetical protein